MKKAAKQRAKSVLFSETLDDDVNRLTEFCDTLGPLVGAWFKVREAELVYGISAPNVVERRHAMLDHLLTLCDDLDWLRRAKAIHAEEKAYYSRKKTAYLAGNVGTSCSAEGNRGTSKLALGSFTGNITRRTT